jgi:hypothetical protein
MTFLFAHPASEDAVLSEARHAVEQRVLTALLDRRQ